MRDIQSSDRVLIERSLSGDRAAFNDLTCRHYPAMYRIAFHYCRDQHAAEDIAQNAFLRMADGLASFRFQSSFQTWLFRLTVNAAHDFVKSRGHTMQLFDADNISYGVGDADAKIFASEVLKMAGQLSVRDQETLYLAFVEDMPHRDIAKILGCNAATVAWRIHKIRKVLQIMAGQGSNNGR